MRNNRIRMCTNIDWLFLCVVCVNMSTQYGLNVGWVTRLGFPFCYSEYCPESRSCRVCQIIFFCVRFNLRKTICVPKLLLSFVLSEFCNVTNVLCPLKQRQHFSDGKTERICYSRHKRQMCAQTQSGGVHAACSARARDHCNNRRATCVSTLSVDVYVHMPFSGKLVTHTEHNYCAGFIPNGMVAVTNVAAV